MSAADRHNELAPEILKRIVRSSEKESEAMVLLESIVAGVCFYYARASDLNRPVEDSKRIAGHMIDALSGAAIERLATL